jgi:hypothetical protein
MDHKSEAFALAGFMLTVNLMRLLAFKGVISSNEAMATVDEACRQLRTLGTNNQAARADMLDRELLDYEALFQEVDERAAQELMKTLGETLQRILESDRQAAGEEEATDAETVNAWQADGWGEDSAPTPETPDQAQPAAAIEISEYEDGEDEPANQR